MDSIISAALGCFTLGLVTTLHPCPLTTNVSAISGILGIATTTGKRALAIIGFSAGFVIALVALAMILSLSIVEIHRVSLVLQQLVSAFLGPLLVLAGMVLTGLISLRRFYRVATFDRTSWLLRGTLLSSVALGFILALAFCPATASVFFGILIPLTIKYDQPLLFPVIYGVGALMPIILIVILVMKKTFIGRKIDWTKKVPVFAGWILIAIGIYITLHQLYF